jgi:hypothetical protein
MSLPFILFAYRSSIQTSLKLSPYRILFGREPIIPGELSSTPASNLSRKSYADEVAAGLQAMKSILTRNLLEAQERQKNDYDKKTHDLNFQVNDLVWLQTVPKGMGAKLQPKWDGPYLIVARPTAVDSVIRFASSPTAERKLVHNNRLKKCYAPWQPPPEVDDADDDIDVTTSRSSRPKPNDTPLEQVLHPEPQERIPDDQVERFTPGTQPREEPPRELNAQPAQSLKTHTVPSPEQSPPAVPAILPPAASSSTETPTPLPPAPSIIVDSPTNLEPSKQLHTSSISSEHNVQPSPRILPAAQSRSTRREGLRQHPKPTVRYQAGATTQ